MREIQQLSGQEYVDVHAKQAKDQLQELDADPDLPESAVVTACCPSVH